jgi:hypothetical protein
MSLFRTVVDMSAGRRMLLDCRADVSGGAWVGGISTNNDDSNSSFSKNKNNKHKKQSISSCGLPPIVAFESDVQKERSISFPTDQWGLPFRGIHDSHSHNNSRG